MNCISCGKSYPPFEEIAASLRSNAALDENKYQQILKSYKHTRIFILLFLAFGYVFNYSEATAAINVVIGIFMLYFMLTHARNQLSQKIFLFNVSQSVTGNITAIKREALGMITSTTASYMVNDTQYTVTQKLKSKNAGNLNINDNVKLYYDVLSPADSLIYFPFMDKFIIRDQSSAAKKITINYSSGAKSWVIAIIDVLDSLGMIKVTKTERKISAQELKNTNIDEILKPVVKSGFSIKFKKADKENAE